jgi:filamentous hemagglutinin
MAYKFQSGLARLGGEVHMDSALLVSGSVNLADKSLPIADLDVNEGTNLGPNAAHTDELIIHDADADATKKIRVVDLGQYLSGSDPTFLQVNQATQAASGSFRVVGHSISGSAALEVVGQSFLQGKVNASGAIEAEGSITAGSSFIIGSADLNEADMEKLDGITNGTVAASKAVVVNATKDATSFNSLTAVAVTGSVSVSSPSGSITDLFVGDDLEVKGNLISHAANTAHGVATHHANVNVTGTIGATHVVATGLSASAAVSGLTLDIESTANVAGVLTAGGLTVGSAEMNEADLEKLDGITNGTVAANKAVVVDGNKDAGGFRNITAVQIGHADDADLLTLADGKLTIKGDVDIQGAFNRITTNATELAVEDVRIIIGSGSAGASQLDGGGIFFGSPGAGKAIAEIAFNDAAEDELIFAFSGSEAMKIDSGGDLTVQGDGTVEGALSGAAGTFDALAGTSLALQGGGISAAGNVAGVGTIGASGLASLDGGINVNDDFTVDANGAVVAVGVNAGGAVTGVTNFSGSGGMSIGSVTAGILGDGVLAIASGSITSLVGMSGSGQAAFGSVNGELLTDGNLIIASGTISQAVNMSGSGALNMGSMIGELISDGTVTIASGAIGSAASVGTVALAVSQTGTLARVKPTSMQYNLASFGSGSGPQEVAGLASGMLHLLTASAATQTTFGGIPEGAGAMFTGTLQVGSPASFATVTMTGSECVKLFVPNLATSDAGYTVSIKKQGLGEGQLVLTASAAAGNVAFDGVLT